MSSFRPTGDLIDGPAVVDERLVCGTTGLTLKQAGDPIFAGSCSVDGALEIEVSELAHAPAHRSDCPRIGRGGSSLANRPVRHTTR